MRYLFILLWNYYILRVAIFRGSCVKAKYVRNWKVYDYKLLTLYIHKWEWGNPKIYLIIRENKIMFFKHATKCIENKVLSFLSKPPKVLPSWNNLFHSNVLLLQHWFKFLSLVTVYCTRIQKTGGDLIKIEPTRLQSLITDHKKNTRLIIHSKSNICLENKKRNELYLLM